MYILPYGLVLLGVSIVQAFNFDESFRAVSRWAGAHGFEGGLLNWEQASWFGSYPKMGTVVFKATVAKTMDIPFAQVDGYVDFGDKMRRTSRFIGSQPGYVAGFPNSEQGSGTIGAVWLKRDVAFVVDVHEDDLLPWTDDISRFRAFSRWAGSQFPGSHGYPNYEQGYGLDGGAVYGVVVIPGEHWHHQDIPTPSLDFALRSGWENMDYGHSWAVLRQHHTAVTSIPSCGYISQDEKQRLVDTYATATVIHKPSSKCSGWACGNSVGYCCDLLTRDEEELGRTAIHEMMHVAGYSHNKTKPNITSSCDAPSHSFFSSPPLRAECCMPGTLQTDLSDDDFENGTDGFGLVGVCPSAANVCPAVTPPSQPPVPLPTNLPTRLPTATPTALLTSIPTFAPNPPTGTPTAAPTAFPTVSQTSSPAFPSTPPNDAASISAIEGPSEAPVESGDDMTSILIAVIVVMAVIFGFCIAGFVVWRMSSGKSS